MFRAFLLFLLSCSVTALNSCAMPEEGEEVPAEVAADGEAAADTAGEAAEAPAAEASADDAAAEAAPEGEAPPAAEGEAPPATEVEPAAAESAAAEAVPSADGAVEPPAEGATEGAAEGAAEGAEPEGAAEASMPRLLAADAQRSDGPDLEAPVPVAAASPSPIETAPTMQRVTGTFADPLHESAFAAQLFRMAYPAHVVLLAVVLAWSTWNALVQPELRAHWVGFVVCGALPALVCRVLLHRTEERMEQLQAEKERLLYDMQRRGRPLDDDDARSAIRRGLQAGRSQPDRYPPSLGDMGPDTDSYTDPSEAGGPAPSDSLPTLPPGPPSSASSASLARSGVGSNREWHAKEQRHAEAAAEPTAKTYPTWAELDAQFYAEQRAAAESPNSSTTGAASSPVARSTIPPPSWAELAYRRFYAERAARSTAEPGVPPPMGPPPTWAELEAQHAAGLAARSATGQGAVQGSSAASTTGQGVVQGAGRGSSEQELVAAQALTDMGQRRTIQHEGQEREHRADLAILKK